MRRRRPLPPVRRARPVTDSGISGLELGSGASAYCARKSAYASSMVGEGILPKRTAAANRRRCQGAKSFDHASNSSQMERGGGGVRSSSRLILIESHYSTGASDNNARVAQTANGQALWTLSPQLKNDVDLRLGSSNERAKWR